MIIELNEIKFNENVGIWDRKTYPAPGMYLANDGINYHIVVVSPIEQTPPMSVTVDFETVKKHVIKEDVKEKEKDFENRLKNLLEGFSYSIINAIEDQHKGTIDNVPQYYTEEKIDGSTLLKALAIAQNPDLSKDLLKEEP